MKNWEHPLCLIRQWPFQGESQRDFLRESEGSLSSPLHDSYPGAGEARNDLWTMSGNFIYRHHVEPRVKFYSPREESFLIPLKYIDTQTNLDVMEERRIDDFWCIGGSRDLCDSWTGFTQFTPLSEKLPEWLYIYIVWWGDWQNGKRHPGPHQLWPELWRGMSKNAKLKEKHKWAIEKTTAR